MSFARLESGRARDRAHYRALRAIRTRKALERSALWAEIGGEVQRVLEGVERGDCAPAPRRPCAGRASGRCARWRGTSSAGRGSMIAARRRGAAVRRRRRVLAQRGGRRPRALGQPQRRARAGRGRRHELRVRRFVPRAHRRLRRRRRRPREHAGAVGRGHPLALSIGRVENIDLPDICDKFHSSEKRRGKKRALLAEIALPEGPRGVVARHLDERLARAARAAARGGARERGIPRRGGGGPGGGDFNTSTYDVSGTLAGGAPSLAQGAHHRFRATVDQYLTPEKRYERRCSSSCARATSRSRGSTTAP